MKDKKIDDVWCHPLMLFALAQLCTVNLALYEMDTHGEMSPHRHYPEYRPERAIDSIQLLFIDGNHFEKVELWHELSPTIIASDIPADNELATSMNLYNFLL